MNQAMTVREQAVQAVKDAVWERAGVGISAESGNHIIEAVLPSLVGVMRREEIARALMKSDGLSDSNIAFDIEYGLPTYVAALRRADAILSLHGGEGEWRDISTAREALQKISTGSFEGISTLAIEGQWQVIATEFQKIARAALLSLPAPPVAEPIVAEKRDNGTKP